MGGDSGELVVGGEGGGGAPRHAPGGTPNGFRVWGLEFVCFESRPVPVPLYPVPVHLCPVPAPRYPVPVPLYPVPYTYPNLYLAVIPGPPATPPLPHPTPPYRLPYALPIPGSNLPYTLYLAVIPSPPATPPLPHLPYPILH